MKKETILVLVKCVKVNEKLPKTGGSKNKISIATTKMDAEEI